MNASTIEKSSLSATLLNDVLVGEVLEIASDTIDIESQ